VIRARPGVSGRGVPSGGLVTAVRRLRAPTADNLLYLPALFAASDRRGGVAAARGRPAAAAKAEALCRNLLELQPALGTLVSWRAFVPTNNAVERALRPAVLWRKRSLGFQARRAVASWSRLLTVIQTCAGGGGGSASCTTWTRHRSPSALVSLPPLDSRKDERLPG